MRGHETKKQTAGCQHSISFSLELPEIAEKEAGWCEMNQ